MDVAYTKFGQLLRRQMSQEMLEEAPVITNAKYYLIVIPKPNKRGNFHTYVKANPDRFEQAWATFLQGFTGEGATCNAIATDVPDAEIDFLVDDNGVIWGEGARAIRCVIEEERVVGAAYKQFGERVQQWRGYQDMSQADLAEGLLTVEMLQQIEQGIAKPSKDVVKEVSNRLHCPMSALVFDTELQEMLQEAPVITNAKYYLIMSPKPIKRGNFRSYVKANPDRIERAWATFLQRVSGESATCNAISMDVPDAEIDFFVDDNGVIWDQILGLYGDLYESEIDCLDRA